MADEENDELFEVMGEVVAGKPDSLATAAAESLAATEAVLKDIEAKVLAEQAAKSSRVRDPRRYVRLAHYPLAGGRPTETDDVKPVQLKELGVNDVIVYRNRKAQVVALGAQWTDEQTVFVHVTAVYSDNPNPSENSYGAFVTFADKGHKTIRRINPSA